MAEYPTFEPKDLAAFSGRPLASYTALGTYVDTALKQATLLFKIGTCLAQLPDDPVDLELARTAILAMADTAILRRPHQAVLAAPFQSENLGSYSYSKMSAAASRGDKTGVMWFDLAVERLSVCEASDGILSGGGIEIFEFDGQFSTASNSGNSVRLLSPQDSAYHAGYLTDREGF